MVLALVLPWFPIILAVGVGGRLLDRTRGFGLGILGALFWLLVVQVSTEAAIWAEPMIVVSIVAGVFTIVAMGGWAGESSLDLGEIHPTVEDDSRPISNSTANHPRTSSALMDSSPAVNPAAEDTLWLSNANGSFEHLDRISTMAEQFADWLHAHRDDSNPWPKFDEFIRAALYQCCLATHVKPYRLCSEGGELKPLREPDPFGESAYLSSRKGIPGHVVTTGRPFMAGDETHGELVSQLAQDSQDPVAWCFAIRQGPHKIGCVAVGHLEIAPERNRAMLRVVEKLVSQFWCALLEAVQSRRAALDDPISGTFSREAFLRVAGESLRESYQIGEPVAVSVIALEGLRELNDSGRWEVADELISKVGNVLTRKIRMDDRLGRFDGSRFVLLLRRVDAELATLIVTQIMAQLRFMYDDVERWGTQVVARCGVVGSGTGNPALRELVSQALMQCRKARLEDTSVSSDLRIASELNASNATTEGRPVVGSVSDSA